MIGCIAPVADARLVLDTNELQDAIWVDRTEVAAVMAGAREGRFSTPPPLAIAHSLLNAWLSGLA
jgi:NAD+ diphosphatase